MALSRWDPIWTDFSHHMPARVRRWLAAEDDAEGWMRIEEREEDDALVIRAELPGVDPDKDVDVEVTDGVVRIAARREEHHEARAGGTFRSEFHYGALTRAVPLPTGVEPARVTAEYRDGILEVRVPLPAGEAKAAPVTTVAVKRA